MAKKDCRLIVRRGRSLYNLLHSDTFEAILFDGPGSCSLVVLLQTSERFSKVQRQLIDQIVS